MRLEELVRKVELAERKVSADNAELSKRICEHKTSVDDKIQSLEVELSRDLKDS